MCQNQERYLREGVHGDRTHTPSEASFDFFSNHDPGLCGCDTAVGAGAAGSWSINNLGPRLVVRNFNPGFFVEHFIKDMGPEMNYELLIGLKPDVVLLYGIGDAQTAVTDKLKELSIPYLYMGEYLEESPLGKAEWMIVLSELTDKREKGIEIFREIPQRYYALKALTDSVSQRPTVMFNTPWNDSWVMPSTQSYMARLIADAGAEYIYKENSCNSSTPIGLETAYGLIQKAEYWINVGSATTLEELKAVNHKAANAKYAM